MSALWTLLAVLALALAGHLLGRARAMSAAGGDRRVLHSLPVHHGASVAIAAAVPALALLLIWLAVQPLAVDARIAASISPEGRSAELMMSDIRRLAEGLDRATAAGRLTPAEAEDPGADMGRIRAAVTASGIPLGSAAGAPELDAAQRYRALETSGNLLRTFAVLGLALLGLGRGLARIRKDFRARNIVERAVRRALLFAASVAVITTLGIVLSLIFNTVSFFRLYPAADFFLSADWTPRFGGGSSLGILPLLWGTLYISAIALAVAVPIGLFAAIYLSEYAAPGLRAIAKPLIEVLAGIPTIVYGLFALLTVGPLLLRMFGPGSLGWMDAASSVLTAGLVMGIMLIPFVSSLSDDIISAVPQSLRDGSLGLGATRSETVRQVVLPAALPGIVGAVLLAASRAIGETMIVVLGAGAAARLSLNPLEAMTTVTAKIVSQLTGDADFSSPEALVAFALAMTLFVLTLGLNVLALYIVRRFREQYE